MKFRLIFSIAALFNLTMTVFAAESCHQNIADKICYVSYENERKCQNVPAALEGYNFAEQLKLVIEKSPQLVKEAVCKLEQIQIVENYTLPWASANYARNKIYIPWETIKDFENERSDIPILSYLYDSEYFEAPKYFKEKMSFFINDNQLDPELNYNLTALFYHELAHLIEDHKDLNPLAPSEVFHCIKMQQKRDKEKILSENGRVKGYYRTFPNQFDGEVKSDLMDDLFLSSFPSFYALMNPTEDFAEMFSEYLMHFHLGQNYQILEEEYYIFDRKRQFKHTNMQSKLNIIKTYLNLPKMSQVEKEKLKQDQLHCRGDFAQ